MPCPSADCQAARRLLDEVRRDMRRRILDDDAYAAEVFARSWDNIERVIFAEDEADVSAV